MTVEIVLIVSPLSPLVFYWNVTCGKIGGMRLLCAASSIADQDRRLREGLFWRQNFLQIIFWRRP